MHSDIARPLSFQADPARVLAAWPRDVPLAVLWSAAGGDPRWSRWTVLARPAGSLRTTVKWHLRHERGLHTAWVGSRDARPEVRFGDDPFAILAEAAASTFVGLTGSPDSSLPPFCGGWIGTLSYELGRAIEPSANRDIKQPNPRWPRMLMHRCPAAYVHDRKTDRWWMTGQADAVGTLPSIESMQGEMGQPANRDFASDVDEFMVSCSVREGYESDVARVTEYIRAGDIFQANIAHPLGGGFAGSSRAFFAAMVEAASPWYAAYIEDSSDSRMNEAVASISPELFLDFDPHTRLVTTRPIKGTRRGDAGPHALAASVKDAAELAMIVDLMRNDLGRVCEFGSIRVVEGRAIERHALASTESSGGLLHGVATVQGRLREGLRIDNLLRATFPAGSITGAPKIRAMQIIHELEPYARGPYSGSIGYISDCGRACFNVAIRTAQLSRQRPDDANPKQLRMSANSAAALDHFDSGIWSYSTGAGIVADSDPASEWDETMAKAGVILSLATKPIESASTQS